VALLGLVPVLNNKYPTAYFPALPPWWVEVLSTFAGIAAALMAFTRLWAILQQRDRARALILEAVQTRQPTENSPENEAANAGRLVSRLVRNADEDLREINPDFSEPSLRRLQGLLPLLLLEIGNLEDARVRLGVLGSYLGETACRNFQWQWFFKADPALRQFSYLASTLQKKGRELDPYAWAGQWLAGKAKLGEFLKEIKA
jgi:hypothetical protein